jgi:hypothetical protein
VTRPLPILAILVLLQGVSCHQEIADVPAGNKQPRTQLWLYPDTTLRTGISRQRLHWWGEDPDGVVIGYLFALGVVTNNVTSIPAPDTLTYTWMTKNDTTMLFPLDTLFRKFAVVVRSVDNSFVGLPERSIVRLLPFPFWDSTGNGAYDPGERQLSTLSSAMDPKGAVLTFPIRNTPPSITFGPNPIDPSIPFKVPETTYTVATFSWKGTDPDGDNTLVSYRIALNDTTDPSRWLVIPVRDTIVTLVVPRTRSDAAAGEIAADVYGGRFLGRRLLGQIRGLRLDAPNVLYLQVKDVAGELSRTAMLPSGSDKWFVKKPRGKLLLVADYINSDSSSAMGTHMLALAGVPGGEYASVDQINIGRGLTANDKLAGKTGVLVPPFVDPALLSTFLLYDYVFWYTDQFPSLGVAQQSLFTYIQNGGKVLFSTTFQNSTDPRGALRDFAPIDSVSSVQLPAPVRPALGDTRIPANYRLVPINTDPAVTYPQLAFSAPAPPATFHLIFMRPIYRRSDARYIYQLQPDTLNTPPRYIGSPNVAVVDGEKHIVFVGLPLHLLDNTVYGNPAGLAAFYATIIGREFSPLQKVNRRRF